MSWTLQFIFQVAHIVFRYGEGFASSGHASACVFGRRRMDLGNIPMASLTGLLVLNTLSDTDGHLVGDAILREISNRLQGSVRTHDFIGRYAVRRNSNHDPKLRPTGLASGSRKVKA